MVRFGAEQLEFGNTRNNPHSIARERPPLCVARPFNLLAAAFVECSTGRSGSLRNESARRGGDCKPVGPIRGSDGL